MDGNETAVVEREVVADKPVIDIMDIEGVKLDEQVYCIPVELIRPDPKQAREWFDPEKLQELADSIEAKGQEQPGIAMRVNDNSGYIVELSAGERRLRAIK